MLAIRRACDPHGEDRTNRLLPVIGPEGGHAIEIYIASLQAGAEVVHRLRHGRGAYVYLIDGAASFDREDVASGDAATVTGQAELVIRAWQTSELVLVDVPMQPWGQPRA